MKKTFAPMSPRDAKSVQAGSDDIVFQACERSTSRRKSQRKAIVAAVPTKSRTRVRRHELPMTR
jgi:hypothetical protein